jgi:hypothetical protein
MTDLPAIRYPVEARTVEELVRHLEQCPTWARGKFAVWWRGKRLGFFEALEQTQGDSEG